MPEIPNDTRPCTCGKLMILRWAGMVLTSYPAQYPTVWFCGECGDSEAGPTIMDVSPHYDDFIRWAEANKSVNEDLNSKEDML